MSILKPTIFKLLCANLMACTTAFAQTFPISPESHTSEFCELASDLGYPSRGYKVETGGCASNMIEVTPTPGRNGLNNNLAFYARGDLNKAGKVTRISIILNVNNIQEKASAQLQLTRLATGVARKLLGKLPPEFPTLVHQAGFGKWEAGPWSIEIKTELWPTGLGQDTTVYFRPK